MIEAMARAIWKATAINLEGARDLDREFDTFSPFDRWPYEKMSTAALIAAAKVPVSEEMKEAGTLEQFGTKREDYHYKGGDARSVEAVFIAMLAQLVREIEGNDNG
jgi:hypothetical protein